MGLLPPAYNLDPGDPRFRLLCRLTGGGHWLRKCEEWARVGTPQADEQACAFLCRAAFGIYTWPDPLPFGLTEEAR